MKAEHSKYDHIDKELYNKYLPTVADTVKRCDKVNNIIAVLIPIATVEDIMVKARKYVVKNTFQGTPKREDYEIVEEELPPIRNGEILVKAEWISVDPYQRAYHGRFKVPYDQFGFQVGLVQDSKDPRYPVGSRVVSHKGWCDYSIVNTTQTGQMFWKLPNIGNASPSLGLSAVGMVGATAYFGLLEICEPKAGETVVVTGAAGATGSLVGQIAKIKGCRVIGFAGSDDKVKWLEQELGFDKAINYKTADVEKALKEAAPKGVDCYFDNVGGELSFTIMMQMNLYGRVAVCGSISSYNEDPSQLPKVTNTQIPILSGQLKVEGFLFPRWTGRHHEAYTQLAKWVKSGELKTREHITEGFENIYDAFIGLFTGENIGKSIVKV